MPPRTAGVFVTCAALLLATVQVFAWQRPPSRRSKAPSLRFEATATSLPGITKSGATAREGMVAADPAVLPMGSRIRVSGAGSYSGVYTVADTGAQVKGRKIDLYVPTAAEAKQFGKRTVRVGVLAKGRKKPAPQKSPVAKSAPAKSPSAKSASAKSASEC